MSIGEKLLNLRKEKGLSQEELANKLNVSRQTVSKWETDQSTPDFDKIVPLCNLFSISTDTLLKGRKDIADRGFEKDDSKRKRKTALVVSVCVALYILTIVFVVILQDFGLSENVIGATFMAMAGLTTCVLIYHFMSNPSSEKIRDKELVLDEEKETKKFKIIDSILVTAVLIIYLLISFLFNSWAISWIIWIVYTLIKKIIKLSFMMEDKDE